MELTFEKAMAELEQIVARLESGEGTLESTFAEFEKALALVKHCNTLLTEAELKVQQVGGE